MAVLLGLRHHPAGRRCTRRRDGRGSRRGSPSAAGRYPRRCDPEPVGAGVRGDGTVARVAERGAQPRRRGSSCAGAIRPQRGWVLVGVVLGLVWTAARVVVPLLVRGAIDHGIEADDQPRARRAGRVALAVVGTVQAVATGLPPVRRLPRRPAGRDRPARPDVRPPPGPALRLPRPGPDRAADEPGEHRPQPGAGVPRDDPADAVERRRRLAVVVVLRVDRPACSRCSRWARCRCSTSSPAASARACTPRCWPSRPSRPSSPSVVEETVSGVRVVKGFGAEDVPAPAVRRRGRRRLRRVDAGDDGPRALLAAARAAADDRPRHHARLRRPRRARRRA